MTDDATTIEAVLDAIEGVMTAHFAGLPDLTLFEYGRLARLVTGTEPDMPMIAVLAAVEVAIAAVDLKTWGDRPDDLSEFASTVVDSVRSVGHA